jgi:hypothetical protein
MSVFNDIVVLGKASEETKGNAGNFTDGDGGCSRSAGPTHC